MSAVVLVCHKVEDFDKWKENFDSKVEMRRAAGEQKFTVFSLTGDPTDVLVLVEFDTLPRARAFFGRTEKVGTHQSVTSLLGAMQEAGVREEPMVLFLDEQDSGDL